MSSISGIDAQGIINGQEPRRDHIDKLRSMSLHMNHEAPYILPCDENQKLLKHPELLDLRKQEDYISQKITRRFGSLKASEGSDMHATYQSVCARRKTCYRKLYTAALTTFRSGFFRNVGTEEIRRQLINNPEIEEAESAPVPSLEFVSSTYSPDRFLIANVLFTPNLPKLERLPNPALVRAMESICRPEKYISYYPGEYIGEGSCPSCQVPFTDADLRSSKCADHVHECFRQNNKEYA